MNYLLSLKKKYLLIIIAFIIIISLTVLLYKTLQNTINQTQDISIKINKEDSDIINPKFTINSKNQKISISANKGNFISNDEILLKNEVVFKSNKFS